MRPEEANDLRKPSISARARQRRQLAVLLPAFLVAVALLVGLCAQDAQAQFFWGWGNRSGQSEAPPRPRRPVGPPPSRQEWSPFPWRWGQQQRPQVDRAPAQAPRQSSPSRTETSNRAPPPKREPSSENAKRVVVLGDSVADWLAYGLEETFSASDADAGEWAVVRKHRSGSSLIANSPRDVDWAEAIKETLASERADFVVMMIGLGDRQSIREDKVAEENANEAPESRSGSRKAPPRAVNHEFRSERWTELYTERVDKIIAALKAKGVPVLWVSLPPINGPRARADLAFLNDIFKARAEKADVVFVDVWDGFIDESGVYSSFGPDVLGQRRRLRSPDGIHFTEAGAVKLAHFVDREIKRILSRTVPVALPAPAEGAPASDAPAQGPAPRPAVGPVISLTGDQSGGGRLLGAAQDAVAADPIAVRVLVRGEPPPPQKGRADSFSWPPPSAVAGQGGTSPQTRLEPEARPETTGKATPQAQVRQTTNPGGAAKR